MDKCQQRQCHRELPSLKDYEWTELQQQKKDRLVLSSGTRTVARGPHVARVPLFEYHWCVTDESAYGNIYSNLEQCFPITTKARL